ncbi:hypothetical protein DXG03_006196 [Asterophora parasitica]|uniref:Kinesin motor domain-containing protein n=1 Tax=Asterophora parasitica TaxID=117018 RepID=A0A9P7KF66_9AGAR|nr:hypothetical protein DXG03_006196 [Asterophora parasitica]
MASKSATRASTRTKTAPAPPPPTTTRATRARTATAKPATPPVTTTTTTVVKKTAARKPLVNRENSVDAVAKAAPKAASARKTTVAKQANNSAADTDREPIMAYLRIRPYLGDDESVVQPYLTPLSDTSVRMADPNEQHNKQAARFPSSTLPPSSIYTFSHVFPPETSQSDFFTKTTLPLVRDVLQGQNGLLFTYGVTNSGKTYTVQGGAKEGSAGILPRTLDVIFNSIDGLHGDGRFRPIRLQGIEPADPSDSKPPHVAPEPALAEVFGQDLDSSPADSDIDPTVLQVDRNYAYTIWLSYAEVYNEKVYDLLDSVKDDSVPASGIPRATTSKTMLLTRAALPLKPSPASDNGDSATAGKYISGLRQFRVHSASQAKALVKLGQLHRRVFGTLANSESSRSHGMVIIKVVKGHRGERDVSGFSSVTSASCAEEYQDPTALQISRLTLVDLAGSERTKHTHTTGDRLREAGNINKSLMVLGQCMEVMRSNQRKLAMSLAQEGVGKEGRMDTRDVKKALAVVPFRHSKLTEALMDYFIGDGKAVAANLLQVMIVNVNPYDTGYDENSHVMRFAALAKEVYITPAPAPVHRFAGGMKGPGKTNGTTIKELGPMALKDPEIAPNPYRRKVTISMGGPGSGKKPAEAVMEVLEEDEPPHDEQDDIDVDEPINPLVDALFDEVESLRMQTAVNNFPPLKLFESEMRCAVVEAETREEVMREMEERMQQMEAMYSRRQMRELEQNEFKTDAKIDMLHQSGLFASPVKKPYVPLPPSDLSEAEEEDVEMSLIHEDDEEESEEEFASESDRKTDSDRGRSMSLSPLAKKGKGEVQAQGMLGAQSSTAPKEIDEVRKLVPGVVASGTVGGDIEEDEEEEDGGDYQEDEDDDEEDEWVPPPVSSTSKAKKTAQKTPSPSPEHENSRLKVSSQAAKSSQSRVSKLARDLDDLSLHGPDDSVVIVPVKKSKAQRPSSVIDEDDDEDDDDEELELPAPKKKKRGADREGDVCRGKELYEG